jgi:hypothetical protein
MSNMPKKLLLQDDGATQKIKEITLQTDPRSSKWS